MTLGQNAQKLAYIDMNAILKEIPDYNTAQAELNRKVALWNEALVQLESEIETMKIELAEDLDAEDFNIILTGYRPTGADIKVYIKAQNAYDNDEFDNLAWTELELFEGVGSYSTISNLNDYREFKYKIADANKVGGLVGGAFAYTSQGGSFEGFKRFQIRIDMLSPNIHNVPTLKDYRGLALT